MKFLGITAFVLFTFLHLTTSINVECRYSTDYWDSILGTIYQCSVQNDLAIKSREESIITSVSETHNNGKVNDDIRAFYVSTKTVNYFPTGIEKIFKNLQGISIFNCELQEIKQSDISVFPELVYLDLSHNNLHVLEQGLFNFNPKLKLIYLNSNVISKIHPNIFDNLKQLMNLYLQSNTCISKNAINNAEKVQSVIQQVKSSCPYAF